MLIAIEEGLFDIKNELSSRGYNTIYLNECILPVDAVVYKSIHPEVNNEVYFSNSKHFTGILMVYANNKTIDEIDNILKTRMYDPLL